MLQLKNWSIADIEYFYICGKYTYISFLPPPEYGNGILGYLKLFPKSIFQMENPLFYYDYLKHQRHTRGLQLNVVEWNESESLEYFEAHSFQKSAKVFFIDKTLKDKKRIIERLSTLFSFSFFNEFPDNSNLDDKVINASYFSSPIDLVQKLKARKESFNELLSLLKFPTSNLSLSYSVPEHLNEINQFHLFKPSHVNFSTLNQILGNHWSSDKKDTSPEELFEESKKALSRDGHDLTRLKILIDQIKLIDRIEISVIERLGIKFPTRHAEFLAPLILVVPFNFPHLGKFLKPFLKNNPGMKFNLLSLTQEQTLSYINKYTTQLDLTETERQRLGISAAQKMSYLDAVAYLQASFKHSPVVRLPQQGNTIKRELSFFQPDAINSTKIKKSTKLFRQFGKKLAANILTDEIAGDLFHSDRQIVAITDLPIEWLAFKNQFISQMHDVTRIPETPYDGILNSYFSNNRYELEIDSNILSKTLVILGSDDPDFENNYKYIQSLADLEGFIAERCSTIADVEQAVRKYSPTFLIFDCHGKYDTKTLSSSLLIGKEELSREKIIKSGISAPIVFLSACHTSPMYGYINSLSQAFFAAGCVAMTATYLPISQINSNILYFRLLKNLNEAANNPVYENWLHYICHILRTSLVTDAFAFAITKLHKKLGRYPQEFENVFHPILARATEMLTSYESRLNAGEYLENEFRRVVPQVKFRFSNIVPEFLFYTNLGRGDLIKFKSWKDEYYKMNNLNN